jgi:hypothetical protein
MLGRLLTIALIPTLVVASLAADLPPGATLLDGDLVWQTWGESHSFHSEEGRLPAYETNCVVSPDGGMVAYVSKGKLWACKTVGGPSSRLCDLPNTITEFWARPENVALARNREHLREFVRHGGARGLRQGLTTVLSLRWNAEGDDLTFTLLSRSEEPNRWTHRVMEASLAGGASEITTIPGGDNDSRAQFFYHFDVTRDRRFVIASAYGRPLIWNVTQNKPQATCFDFITPSRTSERHLAIEIDSRQLVLTDGQFRIIQRFDVYLDHRRCGLIWSDNERFAICRSYVEHPSNDWEGFRVDLKTGETRQLDGGYVSDRFQFTGRRGEFVRIAILPAPQGGYWDGGSGMVIELIPDRDGGIQRVTRFVRRFRPGENDDYQTYPLTLSNDTGTSFAMALPRVGNARTGYHYHLIDQQGHAEPFQPVIDDEYYTPYFPLAFADRGKSIVARDQARLFVIPIERVDGSESVNE